jgi:hypothetical protein
MFDALEMRMDLCIKYHTGDVNTQDTSNEDTDAVLFFI